MSKKSRKEMKAYRELVLYLLYHIKSPESYKRIFLFVQEEVMKEQECKGGDAVCGIKTAFARNPQL